MDIGTGIAIAGIWLFAGVVSASNTVTSIGMYVGIGVAIGMTIFLALL